MTKIIVTADIHGSYNAWLTIKNLLAPSDTLAIAGDLFDTRFGNVSNPDFQPETIKSDLTRFEHATYYVYGNCDIPSFFPGFDMQMAFTEFGKNIFLCHGHYPFTSSENTDIIIQGHTHCCFLKKNGRHIVMNPGSITSPRNGMYTYGVIDKNGASLFEIKTGNKLTTMEF